MMKKLLLASFLILSACQESPRSHEEISLPDSHKAAGIVGGTEVDSTDKLARSVFSLISVYPDDSKASPTGAMTELTDMGYQCTASALTSRLAITAAHCVEDTRLVHRLEITDKDGNKIINKVKKYLAHPDYKTDERVDLALLLLENDLPEDTIYPGLPGKEDYLDLSNLIAAGYGRMTGEKLRNGRAGILRSGLMEAKSYSPEEPTFSLDQTNKKGICSGDSGGPSYIEIDNQLVLVGIASKVTFYEFPGDENPDRCGFKGTMVNVQFHLNWMAEAAETLLGVK